MKGKLTVDDYQATMPVTGEAVQKPPFYYRNMEIMLLTYRTDTEAALAWLPDALELEERLVVVAGRGYPVSVDDRQRHVPNHAIPLHGCWPASPRHPRKVSPI